MKQVALGIGLGYVALALLGLRRERSGGLVCGCTDGCWCKRPFLSTFRWVFPFRHQIR